MQFDGNAMQIGDIYFQVTKEFITKAIGLPTKGESWFKNKSLMDYVDQFLIDSS